MLQQIADQQKVRQAAETEAARQLAEDRELMLQQEAEQQRRRLAEQLVDMKVAKHYCC